MQAKINIVGCRRINNPPTAFDKEGFDDLKNIMKILDYVEITPFAPLPRWERAGVRGKDEIYFHSSWVTYSSCNIRLKWLERSYKAELNLEFWLFMNIFI